MLFKHLGFGLNFLVYLLMAFLMDSWEEATSLLQEAAWAGQRAKSVPTPELHTPLTALERKMLHTLLPEYTRLDDTCLILYSREGAIIYQVYVPHLAQRGPSCLRNTSA